LELLTFASLIFNASATVSALIINDKYFELPVHSAWKAYNQLNSFGPYDPIPSSSRALLSAYGASSTLFWTQWHCEFDSLHLSFMTEHIPFFIKGSSTLLQVSYVCPPKFCCITGCTSQVGKLFAQRVLLYGALSHLHCGLALLVLLLVLTYLKNQSKKKTFRYLVCL
jgi:hypothetical protein